MAVPLKMAAQCQVFSHVSTWSFQWKRQHGVKFSTSIPYRLNVFIQIVFLTPHQWERMIWSGVGTYVI